MRKKTILVNDVEVGIREGIPQNLKKKGLPFLILKTGKTALK